MAKRNNDYLAEFHAKRFREALQDNGKYNILTL